MKEIKLTKNQVALVDDEDFEYLNQFKWCVLSSSKKDGFYAARVVNKKRIFMHRIILNTNSTVDHIDGNTLNNSKSNLRKCSPTENKRNSKIYRSNTSGYKGVHFNKGSFRRKPWLARIVFNKKPICLGYFSTAREAGIAYNEAAKKYFGEFARLNEIN